MLNFVYAISADRQWVTLEFPTAAVSMTFSADGFSDFINKLAWLRAAMGLDHEASGSTADGDGPTKRFLH